MKDSSQIRMNIKTMEDINKLKEMKQVKYLNLDIMNPNLEVIYYLIDHGQNYSYSERIENQNGYIYVPHEIFKQSELFILDIINSIPTNLNEIEIARYLYITIGKNLGYDINILPEKNETFSLKDINMIHNIWGSLSNTKGTNTSFTKLYLYLCRIMNIDCKLITTSKLGYLKNVLTIDNTDIIVDITQDIPFIQAGFKTKNFTGYNDNLELDKKISYIKDDYAEKKIESSLRNLDYRQKDLFKTILLKTQEIIGAGNLKPIELGTIYDLIFSKYCPNYNITINNLYIHDAYNTKEHFILMNYDEKYYSYNYNRNSFVEISKEEIIKNIETKKIGIYRNEKIPFITKEIEKVI
ncbi:MAG: hypothetical protein MR598_04535 [Erysipelotrichaceae bacterium]|nr:hypothetical protein [Erysipelotrichaceae bacterium]